MAERPDTDLEAAGKAAGERTRTKKIKDFAQEKTPKKLKNPTDLQVRFRTGFVYITVSVLCILISEWTTLALLVATATGRPRPRIRPDS